MAVTPVLAVAANDNAPLPDRARASLDRLARLIQLMWLHPAEAAAHRSAYQALMIHLVRDAATPAKRAALLGVVGRMNQLDYLKALTALRAVAA
jgi:hypothetical protein